MEPFLFCVLRCEFNVFYDVGDNLFVVFECVECDCTVNTSTYWDLATNDHIFLEAVETVRASTYSCVDKYAGSVLE